MELQGTEILSRYVIDSKYYCKGCKYYTRKGCKKKRITRKCRKEKLKNV